MESISFKDLIRDIRVNTVLDVGCFGLDGENTTNFLIEVFGASKIHGVCKDPASKVLADNNGVTLDVAFFHEEDYGKYDLVVYDHRIDDNLKWWRNPNTSNIGKYFATYIMTTDQYGDEETPQQIRETWDDVWGGFPTVERIQAKDYSPLKLVKMVTETRRPEITWVLLEL